MGMGVWHLNHANMNQILPNHKRVYWKSFLKEHPF